VQASMIAQSVGCSLGCSHSQLGKRVDSLSDGVSRLRHRPSRARFGGLSEGVGSRGGPEKLIRMATGQRGRRLRLEAAAAAARCSIALLSRRPSVSPLFKSPSPLFTRVLAVRCKRSRRPGPIGEQARTRATETRTETRTALVRLAMGSIWRSCTPTLTLPSLLF
jgi:hypothetical protein